MDAKPVVMLPALVVVKQAVLKRVMVHVIMNASELQLTVYLLRHV